MISLSQDVTKFCVIYKILDQNRPCFEVGHQVRLRLPPTLPFVSSYDPWSNQMKLNCNIVKIELVPKNKVKVKVNQRVYFWTCPIVQWQVSTCRAAGGKRGIWDVAQHDKNKWQGIKIWRKSCARVPIKYHRSLLKIESCQDSDCGFHSVEPQLFNY